MIDKLKKNECCYCSACGSACPNKCITYNEDTEGFLYPSIDLNLCTACNICEKVCPAMNPSTSAVPIITYACKHKDEKIRLNSSSGGVFSALSEEVLSNNGVVFGAMLNNELVCVHSYAENLNDYTKFRGSKYVQSYLGFTFIQVKEFLDADRTVLFTGTPYQNIGLKRF